MDDKLPQDWDSDESPEDSMDRDCPAEMQSNFVAESKWFDGAGPGRPRHTTPHTGGPYRHYMESSSDDDVAVDTTTQGSTTMTLTSSSRSPLKPPVGETKVYV